jgi:hypothetical protein
MKTEIITLVRILDDQGKVINEAQDHYRDDNFDSAVARVCAVLPLRKNLSIISAECPKCGLWNLTGKAHVCRKSGKS